MNAVFGILSIASMVAGFLGMIGSFIAIKFWLITLVIMSILKLTGITAIAWFAGPLTAGAISTGLWMLFLGLIFLLISFVVTAISTTILDQI